jgi:hypothetical protein
MKKIAAFSLLGVLVLGLSAAFPGGNVVRVRADVPFAFYVDKEILPAGSYVFEIGASSQAAATGTSVVIRSVSSDTSSVLFTVPLSEKAALDCLRFNKYGDKYFLARIEGLGYVAEVRSTRMERELRAQAGSAQEKTLVVGN